MPYEKRPLQVCNLRLKLFTVLILGIESSCDETAAAIVEDGTTIISSEIHSQIGLHRPFGGVVPELASRDHLEKIGAVVEDAVLKAGIGFGDIDAIAMTQGPGLIGSLLVGISYGKGLAFSLNVPFIGVNHIEGHVFSVVFDNPPIEYPAIALIVSGGHTNIFYIPSPGKYKVVSRTRDDAAGEAFDKVAKMLGLGYPGGPIIEKVAERGDKSSIRFPIAKISDGRPDLSFSGLKTAVVRYIKDNNVMPTSELNDPGVEIANIAASFQDTVIRSLIDKLRRSMIEFSPRSVILAGGVACNVSLREAVRSVADELSVSPYFCSKALSTDNAAMIAAAGYTYLKEGKSAGFDMTADITLRLQNLDRDDAERGIRKVRYRL